MSPSRAGAALVLLAAAVAVDARANGTPETYGADPRSAAMVNATTATARGWSSSHGNPAAPAQAGSAELGGAFHLSVPNVSVEQEKGGAPGTDTAAVLPPPYTGFSVGAVVPIDLVWKDRFAVGFSGFFPSTTLIHARAYDPVTPFFYLYETYTDHYDISAAASVRLFDWLSAGAGVRLGAGQRGTMRVSIDPLRQRITSQLLDTEQYPIAAPMAGVLLGPLGVDEAKASLGFVWREPVSFPVVLPAAIEIDGAGVGAFLDVLTVANYSPRTFTGGASVDVYSLVSLSLDVQYAQWSEAPPPFLITRTNLEGEGLERLGLGEALDVPAEGESRVPASPGFSDTLGVEAAAEMKLFQDKLEVRAGYAYRPTMVPDQTSGTNIIDSTAHIVGVGASVAVPAWYLGLAKPVTADLALQSQILQPRRANKREPSDPVGDWIASGAVHHLQVGLRYAF